MKHQRPGTGVTASGCRFFSLSDGRATTVLSCSPTKWESVLSWASKNIFKFSLGRATESLA